MTIFSRENERNAKYNTNPCTHGVVILLLVLLVLVVLLPLVFILGELDVVLVVVAAQLLPHDLEAGRVAGAERGEPDKNITHGFETFLS